MRSGIFLLLGTNLGEKLSNLASAVAKLEHEVGMITSTSSIYETDAWGKTDQPSFFNQVVRIDTMLIPSALLQVILRIEQDMGRVRDEKWGPRIIDIDILFYDQLIINETNLSIPHIGIPNRRFVLEPLNEIAPNLFHPGLSKTIGQLLQVCEDHSPVKKL